MFGISKQSVKIPSIGLKCKFSLKAWYMIPDDLYLCLSKLFIDKCIVLELVFLKNTGAVCFSKQKKLKQTNKEFLKNFGCSSQNSGDYWRIFRPDDLG